MPSWGGILRELNERKQSAGNQAYDYVRRKYLATSYQLTKRATILYMSKWTLADPQVPAELLSVSEGDMTGLMEVLHGVRENELDLIIHSPGGSVVAAEAFVKYLRSKFNHIRAIIPHAAMSAASMISCSADEIVMGKHSFMGPTDPQFVLPTALGTRMVPADAILAQFRQAQSECTDPQKLTAWLPMLNQYGPDLLTQCENAIELSRTLVKQWLQSYMFKGQADAEEKAKGISDWLATHSEHRSHGRHLSRDDLTARGLKVIPLEKDQAFQDAILSIFHATSHTLAGTGVVKIIENHQGSAYINQIQSVVLERPKQQATIFMPSDERNRERPPFPKKKR